MGLIIGFSMNLESLLMSRDLEIIRVLRPTLEKLSIDVEICRGARSGNEIVHSEKFDAIIVDCDDLQGGIDVLRALRKTPSNKGSATFAIVNGKTSTQQAFDMGASFVLQKPVSALNALRCFSAALNMMERERRRYFRYPADFPVTAIFNAGEELKGRSTNLSEGGMAVCFRDKIPKGTISQLLFTLPGTNIGLQPKAEVAWADASGRTGLRFTEIPDSVRERLENWLVERMEQMAVIGMPEARPAEENKPKTRQ